MKASVKKHIAKVVAQTKAHKDTFVVPELVEILEKELEKKSAKKQPDEIVLSFTEAATDALVSSPIYSDTLIRELYRSVLDLAVDAGIPRELVLEDLLFQSLRRPPDPDRVKRKRQENAKDRILKAALEEFSAKGFHHSTIDSIAERAGIAKGTVYRYFKTKDELFHALKEDTISEFVELAKQSVSNKEDTVTVLETVIEIYLSFFETNSSLFKVIIQEQKEFGREFSETFINELILAFPGLKRRCWKASRDGYLKQLNYFTVFFGIIGFLNGVIQKWLHDGGQGSLLSEADAVKEVLFYGFVIPDKPDRDDNESDSKPFKVIS